MKLIGNDFWKVQKAKASDEDINHDEELIKMQSMRKTLPMVVV